MSARPLRRGRTGRAAGSYAAVMRGLADRLLIAGGLLMMVPFFWMLVTSLKTRAEVFGAPPLSLPTGPHWENYARCGTRSGRHLRRLLPQLAQARAR